jgi:hypothetical protein
MCLHNASKVQHHTMVEIGRHSNYPARAEDLTVICYGGTFEEGWRKAVIERFEAKYPGDHGNGRSGRHG